MEAVIKLHPIVDTVCVYADPEKTSVVALITSMEPTLHEIRDQLGISSSTSKDELCNNDDVQGIVLKEMIEMAKPQLERFEIPRQIKVSKEWELAK